MVVRVLACAGLLWSCSYGPPRVSSGGDGPGPGDGVVADAAIDVPPDNARQKPITVDRNQVSGDQPGFAVWVLLPTDAELAARATTGGTDIHFTQAGTPLSYEIQRWDRSNGHLEAWVRVDLADAQDTVFEVRYGDPALAHAPNPAAVFGVEYAAVWHFEDPVQLDPDVVDARGMTPGVAINGPTSGIGKLGRGIQFDGTNDEVTFTNPFAGNVAHTISAWVSTTAPGSGYSSVVTVGNPTNNQSRFLHTRYTTGIGFGMFGNGNDQLDTNNIDDDGFALVHWVYTPSGGGGTSQLFVDTNLVSTKTHAGTVNTNGAGGHVGTAPQNWGPGGNTTSPLEGIVDELRLATVNREAGYIETEFANQNRPDLFYAVGGEAAIP